MKKGFTLVELIVVVIIVGILAAIGLTQYTRVVERGRYAEARTVLGTLRSLQIAYHLENTNYATAAFLDSSLPSTACDGEHFFMYTCSTLNGTCTATRCTTGGKTPNGDSGLTKTLDVAGTTWSGSAVGL